MAKTLQLFKAVLSLSNQVCKILFYCPDSTDSEVIYQNLCHIRRKECRQCRSEMDIFDSKREKRQKDDDRFLLIPRNIVDDWKLIDIVQFKNFFQFQCNDCK